MTNRQFGRHQRVSDQLQRELARLIQFEIKDPRLSMLTVSGVRVSRDLSVANVYVTIMEENPSSDSKDSGLSDKDAGSGKTNKKEEVLQVLQKSAGFLRTMLSQSMKLRSVPQLKFHYDESIERGQTLSSLIDKARVKDQKLTGDLTAPDPE